MTMSLTSQITAADDILNLASNAQCQKMLNKQGSCFPEPEKVQFSQKLCKINRKDKEQERILLITDKAIYNLKPGDLSHCKRRIDLQSIASITISSTSDEFGIHIPDEYDYRFKSANKIRISCVLSILYEQITNNELPVTQISQSSLKSVTITKDSSQIKTREERLKRYRELMQQDLTGSDDEEQMDMASGGPVLSLDEDNLITNDMDDDMKTNSNSNSNSKNSNSNQAQPEPALVTADEFEFLKVIGRGSFGKVMQVQKKDTKEILAMKILKKKAIIQRNQVEHTRAERLILQKLQHPFLMKLRYAFQTQVKLYFVLDYYRGGELFFHLKKKRRFRETEAQIIVGEVAMALGYLHSLGVIYRDLKPENILLDIDGHICLTDFGLSKQTDFHKMYNTNKDGTSSSEFHQLAHTFCGTPEYLAPEIVTNVGHGKAVDWWSLGILLYELTVGIPPFYSQNVNEMYKKIQNAPLQFPPQTTLPCKALICLLLERDPITRLGSGSQDFEEIQRQAFFKNIDWIALYNKEIEAVYKPPTLTTDADDSSCFDQQFTNEAPIDSYVTVKSLAAVRNNNESNENKIFSDFGFAAK